MEQATALLARAAAAVEAELPARGVAVPWPELRDALVWIGGILVLIAALVLVLPGRKVKGYVLDARGEPLYYILNGFQAHIAIVALAYYLVSEGLVDGTFLAKHTWAAFVAANVYGLSFTAAFLVRGWLWPETIDRAYVAPTVGREKVVPDTVNVPTDTAGSGHGVLYDFYVGLSFNPRVGEIDVKMFLYLFGALLIQLIVLSIAYTLYLEQGRLSTSVIASSALLSYFVLEYNYHEHVHLYTYDLFAEKIGFKLTWGCTVFYPFFYTLGLRPLLSATAGSVTVDIAAASAGIFLLGYILSRGANNQKHAFRVNPTKPFLFGLVEQRAVPGSRLLCSGWWALARHINYFGEMLMALGIALPAALATGSWLPWTYPLYYVVLLVPRDLEDNRICAAKYGAHWTEYARRVPYHIIPWIY